MTYLRIAGLMRSGSNLLTWMLRHNFEDVRTATMLLGWKHGPILRGRTELTLDDYVDPRYRSELQRFVREQPAHWSRLVASDYYRGAAEAQRAQSYGVALAVRDPALWYASCVRVAREAPGFLLHGIAPAEAARYWNERHCDWLESLGERSAIVDTDALRADPEPWLERMARELRLRRQPTLAMPRGYLHPRGTEEVYELLGAPVVPELERAFTTREQVDAGQLREFAALLDRDILRRLGLGS